jgi:putative membrane protein
MNTSVLMAVIHHLMAFTLVSALAVELATFGPSMSVAAARRLQRIDLLFGLSAATVLVVGLLRVTYFEKGPAYYWHNAYFLLKFGAFLLAALISIYPTVKFLSWGAALKAGREPSISPDTAKRVRLCLGGELICIAIILACAALMARGFGVVR